MYIFTSVFVLIYIFLNNIIGEGLDYLGKLGEVAAVIETSAVIELHWARLVTNSKR